MVRTQKNREKNDEIVLAEVPAVAVAPLLPVTAEEGRSALHEDLRGGERRVRGEAGRFSALLYCS